MARYVVGEKNYIKQVMKECSGKLKISPPNLCTIDNFKYVSTASGVIRDKIVMAIALTGVPPAATSTHPTSTCSPNLQVLPDKIKLAFSAAVPAGVAGERRGQQQHGHPRQPSLASCT